MTICRAVALARQLPSWRRPVCGALVALCGFFVAASDARAEATRCDILAANPLDPHKLAPGVKFETIDARQAIAACKTALKNDARNPRLQFQLGRALERSGAFAEALIAYRSAAELGYAPAQNALGGMYEEGIGVPPDPMQAQAWFRRAADQGYQPAVAALVAMAPHRVEPPEEAAPAAATPAATPDAAPAKEDAPRPPEPVPLPATAAPPQAEPAPTAPLRPAPNPPPFITPSEQRAVEAAPAAPPASEPAPMPAAAKPEQHTVEAAPAAPPAPAPASTAAPTPAVKMAKPPSAPATPPAQQAAAVAAIPPPASDLDAALTSCILPELQRGNYSAADRGQSAQLLLGKCQRPWLAWVGDCVEHGNSKEACIKDSTLITQTAIERFNK